jgi:tRNA modification GTPase
LKLKLTAIQGFKVVLIGETNSGKSSLFNLLINDNRAIISSTPGTTRDYLEKQISIQGIPINLYDTAGLRSTKSKIEKEGILKTYELIKQADLVILLRDNSLEYPKSIIKYLKDNNINYFKIANKSDLESTIPKEVNEISISTLNHTNIDEVIKKIQDLLNLKDLLGSNYSLNNHRQLNLLYGAKTKLIQIINDSNIYQDTGLLVDLLNQSISDICHIYGDNYEFEPIKEMFAKFCIGK